MRRAVLPIGLLLAALFAALLVGLTVGQPADHPSSAPRPVPTVGPAGGTVEEEPESVERGRGSTAPSSPERHDTRTPGTLRTSRAAAGFAVCPGFAPPLRGPGRRTRRPAHAARYRRRTGPGRPPGRARRPAGLPLLSGHPDPPATAGRARAGAGVGAAGRARVEA